VIVLIGENHPKSGRCSARSDAARVSSPARCCRKRTPMR
jgi:hypothetical protein